MNRHGMVGLFAALADAAQADFSEQTRSLDAAAAGSAEVAIEGSRVDRPVIVTAAEVLQKAQGRRH